MGMDIFSNCEHGRPVFDCDKCTQDAKLKRGNGKGHTIFACENHECSVITFYYWSNQPDSPSREPCPACCDECSPFKAIFNREHPDKNNL